MAVCRNSRKFSTILEGCNQFWHCLGALLFSNIHYKWLSVGIAVSWKFSTILGGPNHLWHCLGAVLFSYIYSKYHKIVKQFKKLCLYDLVK